MERRHLKWLAPGEVALFVILKLEGIRRREREEDSLGGVSDKRI